MPSPKQPRQQTPGLSRPLWLRALTIFALLLVSIASTVQVCHSHGEPGAALDGSRFLAPDSANPSQSDGSSLPGQSSPEDHCPLCVAMHSALPATMHIAPEPLVRIEQINSVAADAERVFHLRFELLSRPPPAPSFPS